jgi:glycosyltransferase involved in cell wall biosynthesis
MKAESNVINKSSETTMPSVPATASLSVLLSTHNPHPVRLARTLDSLFAQTLPGGDWELVIVDNRSAPALDGASLRLARHLRAQLVREERLGLIYGRITGFKNSTGELTVFCDDDTMLEQSYLQSAITLFSENPKLGCAIGMSLPEFELRPPTWTNEFFSCLGLWNHGAKPLVQATWDGSYPIFAGGGGGAIFRRAALADILNDLELRGEDKITGRVGRNLASGEDNHIVLSLLKKGWTISYVPELKMTHLIPAFRLTRKYLGQLNHGIARSWVQVLALHGICPWKPVGSWTVPLRKCRAYFRYHAWAGPAEYVRWRGACGHFEGRALI